MDEGDSGTPVVIAPSGPPAFSYDYSSENISVPFHAYSNTEFRIILSGECEYSFDLFIHYPDLGTTEYYDTLAQGQGNTDELFYDNLPDNEYLIVPDVLPLTDTGQCEWNIIIRSIFSDSGDSA